MNDNFLMWGLGLLAAGVLLVVLEVFVPSGGALAFISAVVTIAGIVSLFKHSTMWGLSGILAVMVLGPMTFAFALKVWPSTPIGRRLMGERPAEMAEAERLAEQQRRRELFSLVDQEGVALTALRPVGVVKIEGARFDALSEVGYIEAGQRVRVTMIDGVQVKVRPVV